MNKKVSILVPVYNVESSLDKCVQSILKQTYNNFELVLVDDCSTDNSLSMCYEYAEKDKRIKVIKKESHTCLSDVRNIGIENATGEYIMFVDSDDFVYETFVEDMVEAIENKNVDVVRCKALEHKKDGSTCIENHRGYENKILRNNEFRELIPHLVTLDDNIACYSWALIIKKNVLNIRFNPSSYCLQDTIFFVELLLKSVSSIYFLDKPLYEYCFNKKGTSHNGEIYFKYIDGLVNVKKRIKMLLKEDNLLSKELEKKINNFVIEICFSKTQSLLDTSVFNIAKSLKQIFNMKELRAISKNMDKSCLITRKLIRYYLIKMRLYFLTALLIKMKGKMRLSFSRVNQST